MKQPSHSETIRSLRTIVKDKGVRAAVIFLNSQTSHRFTSLFRFDEETLRSITFYDRENPEITNCEEIPVEASYCVFLRSLGTNFLIKNADKDERVKDHIKRDTVKRYCGVPLLDRYGKMFGSICHFDFEPGHIANEEVELLEYMAGLLQPTNSPPPGRS